MLAFLAGGYQSARLRASSPAARASDPDSDPKFKEWAREELSRARQLAEFADPSDLAQRRDPSREARGSEGTRL